MTTAGSIVLGRRWRRRSDGHQSGPSPKELEALAQKPADWPRSCFLVCSTPRTGSTLLARLLASTGRVGDAREYFSEQNEPAWAKSNYAEFVEFTKRRHAVDGVFGAKLHSRQLMHLLDGLSEVTGRTELGDRALLDETFAAPSFLWIRREDVVAQAVSWLRADQTGIWSSDMRTGDEPGPVFDFRRIDGLVEELRDRDAAWNRWFAANGIKPFTLTYEELAQDLRGTTQRALGFLGIELGGNETIKAGIDRLSDAVNEEWIVRYNELAGGRPPA